MLKYRVETDFSAGPEDTEAGRCYSVLHTLNWQDDRHLAPVAQLCTMEDAERICRLLNTQEDFIKLHLVWEPRTKEEWFAELTKIANEHNLEPEGDPSVHPTWATRYEAGMTPQEAWNDVPWRSHYALR